MFEMRPGNSAGYVLVAILILLFVLTTTALSAANMALLDTQLSGYWLQQEQVRAAARSSLAIARNDLLADFEGEASLTWFDGDGVEDWVGFAAPVLASAQAHIGFDLSDNSQWPLQQSKTASAATGGSTFGRYVVEYLGKIEQSPESFPPPPQYAFRVTALGYLDKTLNMASITHLQQSYLLLQSTGDTSAPTAVFRVVGETWRDVSFLE